MTRPTPRGAFALGASNACLISENPTWSAPALQGSVKFGEACTIVSHRSNFPERREVCFCRATTKQVFSEISNREKAFRKLDLRFCFASLSSLSRKRSLTTQKRKRVATTPVRSQRSLLSNIARLDSGMGFQTKWIWNISILRWRLFLRYLVVNATVYCSIHTGSSKQTRVREQKVGYD